MEVELRICQVESEQRWNWLQVFENEFRPLHERIGVGRILGQFLSFRDDATLVWLHGFRDAAERLASRERLWNDEECKAIVARAPAPVRETVVTLRPAEGSAIQGLDDFERLEESPVLEIRLYRIAAGMRSRFATFFHERATGPQIRFGMTVHGQFDALDDENLFVWFRGFPSLVERERRKAGFYQSAVWYEELEADAFSMIEDYSNVLLVTPVGA